MPKQRIVSPETLREKYLDQRYEAEYKDSLKRKEVARRMVKAMSEGAEITASDFVFAASLGREEKETQLVETVEKLYGLKGGELVGVHDKTGLNAIGLMANPAIQASVHTDQEGLDFHQDGNRTMEIDVLFAGAFILRTPSYAHQRTQYDVYPDPKTNKLIQPYTVVNVHGEPIYENTPTEYYPKTIAIGGLAIANVLPEEDVWGREVVETFMNRAFRAVDPSILTRHLCEA